MSTLDAETCTNCRMRPVEKGRDTCSICRKDDRASRSLSLSVPFHGHTLSVQISAGERLRREHIEKVRKYLELTENDLEPESNEGN